MRGFVPPDPETDVSGTHYAVVHQPRTRRTRFPAAGLELVATAEQARARADPARRRYPARVLGPSKSSEGQYLYYLVEWLDEASSR
jgi:hypothetical protein